MAVKIAVLKEHAPGERRVALAPDGVAQLTRLGAEVWVEAGAGERAYFADAAYAAAGAKVEASLTGVLAGAAVVLRVVRPDAALAERLPAGSVLIALLQPAASGELLQQLAERGVTALSLEWVPRISRAQSMDVLSSQATVAGYQAALMGAGSLPKFLPMLTTAAGSIAPGKAFVIGAGVAGLQAIATVRRLGAVVSAFDIRAAAAEQVQSLGASFVAMEVVSASAETAGGYARAQSEDEQARTLAAIAGHIRDQDLVITTAQIPGRPAPVLITAEMVGSMRPGSVIVDVAAEAGGNCELSRPGETVQAGGVRVIAPLDLASSLPIHASQMFSRNVVTLLKHLMPDGEVKIDPEDPITGPMLATPPVAVGK
jgi:H+-translocating NAD(P) transhydrogenase subunit alpha